MVASVPQRPVQFSFLPFPVLPLPLPLPSFPRVGGSNIDSDISTGILFFFSIPSPPPPAPSLLGSLPLFFIKWRTGCETRNSHPPSLEEGHNSPSRKCSSILLLLPPPRFLDRRGFSKSIPNILSTKSSLFRTRLTRTSKVNSKT